MSTPLGSVDVEVRATLTVYDKAIAEAEKTAREFEKNAVDAMNAVDKASQEAGAGAAGAMDAAGKAGKEAAEGLDAAGKAGKEAAASVEAVGAAAEKATGGLNGAAGAAGKEASAAGAAAKANDDLTQASVSAEQALQALGNALEAVAWGTENSNFSMLAFELAQQRANKEAQEATSILQKKAQEAKRAAEADAQLAKAEKAAADEAKKMADPIEDAADAIEEMAEKAGVSHEALGKLGQAGGNIVGQITSGRMSIDSLASSATKGGEALLAMGGRIAVVGGLVAAAAAAAAAAAVAWWQYDASVRAVENTLKGSGRSLGLTAGDFQDVAEAAAEAANIHVGAAEKIAAGYARMGISNTQILTDLIAITGDYAAVTGQDLAQAQAELGASFDDPIAGVETLNDRLNLLDATTTQHVLSLARQGRETEANTILMNALKGEVGGTAQNVNILAGAWRNAAAAARDYWRAFGKGVDVRLGGGTNNDQLEAARKSETSWVGRLNDSVAGAFGATRPFQQRREQLEAQQAQEQAAAAAAKAEADLAEATRSAQESLQAAMPWVQQRAVVSDRMAKTRRDMAAGLITEAQATRALAADQVRLNQIEETAGRNGGPKGRTGRGSGRDEARRAENLRRQGAAMEENARQGLLLADAYLEGEEAAIRAEASRKALTEATRRGTDQEAQYRRQLAIVVADAAVAGAKATAATRAQSDALAAANDNIQEGTLSYEEAIRAMRVETALRPLLAAATVAEGEAREALTAIIDAQRKSLIDLNKEEARSATLKNTEALKRDLALLELETSLLGKNNQERRTALAMDQARHNLKTMGVSDDSAEGQAYLNAAMAKATGENALEMATHIDRVTQSIEAQIRAYEVETATIGMTWEEALRYRREQELIADAISAGIPLTDKMRESLGLLADAYSEAAIAAQKAQDHMRAVAEASDFTAQSFTDFFDSIIFGGAKGEDALRSLVRTLGQAAHQAVTMGQGPLAGIFGTAQSGGAFGGGAEGGGGIFGSIFKSIFKAPVAHNGMNAGSMPSRTRSVDPGLFIDAPRLHQGLAPDEFPAILQRGEEVVPKHGRRRGGDSPVNITVNANDADSFRRSERQIGRAMKRRMKL